MTDGAKNEVRVLFAGDVAPVQREELAWAQRQPHRLCAALVGEIETSEAFIVNLECPLTDNQCQVSKYGPHLKSSTSAAEILAQMGVAAVSLANNHILDYGPQGVCDTMRALKENGVRYFGAGPTAEQAREPFFLEIGDQRVGILAYAEHEFNWQADDAWTTGLIDPAANVLQIMRVRSECDRLIVFSHCGPEHHCYPSPRMTRLFHAMVEAGADAVVNSHSHTVMGIEQYEGAAICYGLGNFWFPRLGQSGAWNVGLMVRLHLGPSGVAVEPIGVEYVPETGIVPIGGPAFAESLRQMSQCLGDEAFIRDKWLQFCLKQRKRVLHSACKAALAMLPGLWYRKLCRGSGIRADGRFLKGANLYRGLVTCENYGEILSTIFDQMRKGA
jgi:poly-gamma-glutamate synthesis protein (capsule biosynthesis protein)